MKKSCTNAKLTFNFHIIFSTHFVLKCTCAAVGNWPWSIVRAQRVLNATISSFLTDANSITRNEKKVADLLKRMIIKSGCQTKVLCWWENYKFSNLIFQMNRALVRLIVTYGLEHFNFNRIYRFYERADWQQMICLIVGAHLEDFLNYTFLGIKYHLFASKI